MVRGTVTVLRLLYRRFVRKDIASGAHLWAKTATLLIPARVFHFTPDELAVIHAPPLDHQAGCPGMPCECGASAQQRTLRRVVNTIAGEVPHE